MKMSWKGWVTLIVAMWLIIAAFIPGITGHYGANLANDLIVGIIFAVLGFMMLPAGNKWQGWTIGISGIWMIIASFIPLGKAGNLWNDLIFGLIVLIVSFFEKKEASA